MKANDFTTDFIRTPSTRVGVIASPEVAQKIQAALGVGEVVQTEVGDLPWPVSGTLQGESGAPLPDVIVCEIHDPAQAAQYRQALASHWPAATLISCTIGKISDNGNGDLAWHEASQRAGYQGHLVIDEVALQLPIFLRYAEQRRAADEQSRQLLQLKKLLAAANRMHASLDQQQIAEEILGEFSGWVKADNWQLYVLSDNEKFIELIGSEGTRIRPPSLTLRANGKGIIERVLQQGEMVVLQPEELPQFGGIDNDKRDVNGQFPSIGSVLCFPLKVSNQVIGVSQATRLEGNPVFSRAEQLAIAQVSPLASLALNNAVKFARAERLYMQDDLTLLHNSRYLRQYIEAEFKRVKRYGGQVAVIFIDLDGFKGVNDRFGHRVGSETLKEVSHLLMESVRDTDVVTRYGGDEFTIVMPNTDAEKALISAERVRQKVADHEFRGDSEHTFRLTASFGIASYPECHAQSAADLLEKADLAMYEAKAANKNNVKLAKPVR